jgi:TetR/AcrR family transcriptional regulator, transcriptional repressor for nem operon
VFTQELECHFEVIAAQLTDEDETERRGRAMQIIGVMLGSLQLARAIEDRDASDRMLEAGVKAALSLTTH